MKRVLAILVFTCLSFIAFPQTGGAPAKQDTASHTHISKIGLAIGGTLGAGLAASNAGTPETSHLSYMNLSNASAPARYSSQAGIHMGIELGLLLGKQKNWELSTGLTYSYSKGTADYSGFHAEYEAQDASGNFFRRLLTVTHATESISYSNASIPVLVRYSSNPAKKYGVYIQAGPVLSVYSAAAAGALNTTTDFEAAYHYDVMARNFAYTAAPAPGDWLITRQAVSSQGQNPAAYFSQLYQRGYYVGLGEAGSAKAEKMTYGVGGGIMASAGGICRASSMVNVLYGITFLVASNGRSVGSYAPVTASNDLNTVSVSNFLQGTSSLMTMQIGLCLGVQVKLIR